jgi:hypothetical protein
LTEDNLAVPFCSTAIKIKPPSYAEAYEHSTVISFAFHNNGGNRDKMCNFSETVGWLVGAIPGGTVGDVVGNVELGVNDGKFVGREETGERVGLGVGSDELGADVGEGVVDATGANVGIKNTDVSDTRAE